MRRCKGLSGAPRSYTQEAGMRIRNAKSLNAKWLDESLKLGSDQSHAYALELLSASQNVCFTDCSPAGGVVMT